MAAATATSGPDPVPVEGKTVKALTLLHLKRTYELFAGNHGTPVPLDEEGCAVKCCSVHRDDHGVQRWVRAHAKHYLLVSFTCRQRIKLACKVHDEYAHVMHVEAPAPSANGARTSGPAATAAAGPSKPAASEPGPRPESHSTVAKMLDSIKPEPPQTSSTNGSKGELRRVVYVPGTQEDEQAWISRDDMPLCMLASVRSPGCLQCTGSTAGPEEGHHEGRLPLHIKCCLLAVTRDEIQRFHRCNSKPYSS